MLYHGHTFTKLEAAQMLDVQLSVVVETDLNLKSQDQAHYVRHSVHL